MASQENIAYQMAHASDDQSSSLYATSIICFILATAGVAGRISARQVGKIRLSFDDWLMVASLIFSYGVFSLNIVITKQGLGRHEIFVEDARTFVIGYTMVEVTYTLAIMLIKLSTLALWNRIFPGKGDRITLYSIAAVIFAYSATQLISVICQCIPLDALWNKNIKGKCISIGMVFFVCSVFNVLTDAAILSIPISHLWRLQLSKTKKVQLTGLFLLGGFVLIISIVRLPKLREISVADESWTLTATGIWSCLECAVATLSGCLPVMNPLLVACLPRIRKSSAGSGGVSGGSGWVKVSNDKSKNRNSYQLRQGLASSSTSGSGKHDSAFAFSSVQTICESNLDDRELREG